MKKLEYILLVDDDQTSNFLNKKILVDLKIAKEVITLTNGKLALDYLQNNCVSSQESCPGLIILDHQMPVMNGLELMKTLNITGLIKSLEVVFLLLAIQTKPEELVEFKKLGVQEFTYKPLTKKKVMESYLKYWQGDTANQHSYSI